MRKEEKILDFSDPGTGKTRAHLEVFAERRREGYGKALILAPKTLLDVAWGSDIKKFTPDMIYICAYAENREKAFSRPVDIYITNIDAATWLVQKPAKWFKQTFGENATLIIDELTAYKHRTSARSKAVKKITKYFRFRSGLTGTPNPNSVQELWHQALLIDEGKRLGTSFYAFRNECCAPHQVGPRPEHIQWVDKPGIEDVVGYMLKDITVRHQFDEVMDVPENYARHISFDLHPRVLQAYRELEAFAYIELQGDSITAINAAALQSKLLQLASGAAYSEAGYAVLDKTRYELVLDLVEERTHSIVFFNWKHQKEQLVELANKRGITYEVIDGDTPHKRRTQIVEAYQAGHYQTLFLHPATGAHGLTLTRGRTTIWSSPIFQADWLKQGIHRICRGGQTEKTETIFVEANDTLEHRVYERLNDKTTRMVSLLDILNEAR
jgi:SNF2 family DNA or RNA helicase